MTHVNSGWENFILDLEQDKRIHCFHTKNEYHHPLDIESLTSHTHKNHNAAAIWADVILHNEQFTMKLWCEYYNFAFFASPRSENINQDYYDFRLEGMKQYYDRAHNILKVNPFFESITGRKDGVITAEA